ncbi:MAG: hypothetical protein BWY01_01559 [Synergistetes bacterium ADurb.Bin155]|jgi:hypothetical protein|nr:MAG: hypothetical protein BWY01_01559 [Synergistetes bacterium ADurb.Bin155]
MVLKGSVLFRDPAKKRGHCRRRGRRSTLREVIKKSYELIEVGAKNTPCGR